MEFLNRGRISYNPMAITLTKIGKNHYFDMEYRFNGRSIFNMSRSFLIITTT